MRWDAMLLGIYRCVRQLAPSPGPDFTDLSMDYLTDLLAVSIHQYEQRQKVRRRHGLPPE